MLDRIARPLILTSLLFAAACSGDESVTGPDAGPADAGEVPDACTEAMPCVLEDGGRATDWLSPVGDADPWTFEVTSVGQVVNLVLENDAQFSPVRLQVTIFAPDGTAIENERYQGTGTQRVELQFVAAAAGTYRAEVRDVGNDGADRRNPYFITVNLLSETDDNEPNDTFDTPTALTPGTPVSGTIGVQGDEDWFAIEVGANQLVQVQMSAPAESEVRLRWSLYDATGTTRIAESVEPEGVWPVENRAVGNAAGTYLVKVEDDPDDGVQADLSRVYLLTVRLVAEPDVQEQAAPNDTPQTATAVTSGQTITGYIGATSDVDYFAIQVPNAQTLLRVRAQTSGASDVDLALTVFGSDGETLICDARDGDLCKAFRFLRDGSTGPADLVTAHLAEAPGTYYVRISDQQDNDFDTAVSYTVTIDLPAEPDPNEDYNLDGRSGAIRVAPTSTVGPVLTFPEIQGYISHSEDRDWFAFEIPGPETLDPAQNGDWLLHLELDMDAPTPVELQAFFYGESGSARQSYRGYGQRCRDPSPSDPMNCQFPDADNGISLSTGETSSSVGQGECFVVFREVTAAGPHYFRMSDLDGDDFDLGATGRYRLRLTATAGCPDTSVCSGVFEENGADLCGRP